MKIIYQDDDILVLDKPSGILVHSDGRSEGATVVDWLLENFPEVEKVGETMRLQNREEILRPGIVHRLDRDTSGCLLVARSQEVFLHLKAQFKNRSIKKSYNAFAHGFMKEDEGEIRRQIARSRSKPWLWSAEPGARGNLREAVTAFTTLNRFEEDGERFSYLELQPETGRTHQLRVHLKYLSRPIVADPLYGKKDDHSLGFKRLALHATQITFKNMKGAETTASASLPADFQAVLARHKNSI